MKLLVMHINYYKNINYEYLEKIVKDLNEQYPQCVHSGVVDLGEILSYLQKENAKIEEETAKIKLLRHMAPTAEISDIEFLQNIMDVMYKEDDSDYMIPLSALKESARIMQETLDEVNKIHAVYKNKITVVLV